VTLSGILNVNKPPDWTSFDVVRFVRGHSRQKRVGHAGTLDPAATGVLPVLIGQATRLTEYLVDTTKEYVAEIELGLATDTYDAEGEVVARHDASSVSEAAVREALQAFQGEIMQAPPVYSAIKRQGVPLYKRARRGEDVHAEPRPVRAEQFDIISYDAPKLELRVVCGKGFYVRSLAHDLGAVLGVGGMLSGLVRSRVGPFRIDDAVEIERLRAELEDGAWTERLIAADEVLLTWRAAILGEAGTLDLLHGRETALQPASGVSIAPGDLCRAYSDTGDFLAILRCTEAGRWQPDKVFAQALAILNADSVSKEAPCP
jgi:tRNA pseudouridine55 synthase